jgi:nucleoside-diphosphate-sugar epimerase
VKKNILIVGGAGYIGGFLTDLLKNKADLYDITVYDSLLYENRFLKDVNFINGDIRDIEKLNTVIHKFDVVVWLAALVGDGACSVDVELTKEINFTTVKWLVDNYKGKIVFPSTCSVYGVNNDLIDETAEPNPLSAYALTKLEAERYILANCNNYLIFRLGTLYGVGDSNSRLRLDLVLNILTMKASLGQDLTVFGGEQWRPLLHVRDVGYAIEHGIFNDIKGLYNLSQGNYKISDLANEVKKYFSSINVNKVDMKFEDLRNYRVKDHKYKETGWTPKYSLRDGIEQIKKVITEKRLKNHNDSVYSNAVYIKENYDKAF